MLYLIGLGLDERDLSLKALDALKACNRIYCEFYTAKWNGITIIERLINKKIKFLERKDVESDRLVSEAAENDIALLVPGDPLAATTHFQLVADAKDAGVRCEVMHAPSIYTAVAETGLQLYKFGRATTLTRDNATSPYEVIRDNKDGGLHSLVLLDVDMNAKQGAVLLARNGAIAANEHVLVCSALGTPRSEIRYVPAGSVASDKVPAVIIIPGNLNFKEEEALELWI